MSRKKSLEEAGGEDALDDIFAQALRSVERHERRRAEHGAEVDATSGDSADESPFNMEETIEEIVIPEDLESGVASLETPFAVPPEAPAKPRPVQVGHHTQLGARTHTPQASVSVLEERLRTLQHERELERAFIERLKQRTSELAKEAQRLEGELEEKKAEAQKAQEKVVWMTAELENSRKRQAREKAELERYGNERILRDILPVLDNLERAMLHAKERPEVHVLQEGVQMTVIQFLNSLKRHGVHRIELEPGMPFDPTLHEAMMQEETATLPAHSVVREMQAGYLHNERLLRASLVTVARPVAGGTVKSESKDETD